jgi:hypothetical protein
MPTKWSPRVTPKMEQHDERMLRQREVVTALRAIGADNIAARLQRCVAARVGRSRQHWPWRCHSSGCQWCGPRAGRRWWRGIEEWAVMSGEPCALVVISAPQLPIMETAPRLRRGLRDVRDRAARLDRRWRSVSMAGVVDCSGRALVLVRHPSLPPDAVASRMARRWPSASLHPPGSLAPRFDLTVPLAVALAAKRRGVQPLRIVIMPQRPPGVAEVPVRRCDREPMPLLTSVFF